MRSSNVSVFVSPLLFFLILDAVVLSSVECSESYVNHGSQFLLLSANGLEPSIFVARKILTGQGIPYVEKQLVNASSKTLFDDASLPALVHETEGYPLFAAIILTSNGLAFEKPDKNWTVALNSEQEALLDAYEIRYGVRRVVLNTFPTTIPGVTTLYSEPHIAGRNITNSTSIYFDDNNTDGSTKSFVPAVRLNMTTYHLPAVITDDSLAKPFAYFEPPLNGVAAAISTVPGKGEQLHLFFTQDQYQWYSSVMAHVWTTWATRGLFVGSRRIYLSAAMDDVFLSTQLWDPAIKKIGDYAVRSSVFDFEWHANWTHNLNDRLPKGSSFKIEMPFNGDGILLNGGFNDDSLYLSVKNPALLNEFYWLSHTFSHLDLTKVDQSPMSCNGCETCNGNITSYNFTTCELMRNQIITDMIYQAPCGTEWNSTKLPAACATYSERAIVTPKISGLFNGEAIHAMVDAGIKYAVGDNSRQELIPANKYHGIWTNTAVHGYPGLFIIPRFATEIYYNSATPYYNAGQYNNRYSWLLGNLTMKQIIGREAKRVLPILLSYRHDPYMFHQANLHVFPLDDSHNASLLSMWVDELADALVNIINFPVLGAREQDLGDILVERMERDACQYDVRFAYFNKTTLLGMNISTSDSCIVGITGAKGLESDAIRLDTYGPETTTWVTLNKTDVFVPVDVSEEVLPIVSKDIIFYNVMVTKYTNHTGSISFQALVQHPLGPGYRDISIGPLSVVPMMRPSTGCMHAHEPTSGVTLTPIISINNSFVLNFTIIVGSDYCIVLFYKNQRLYSSADGFQVSAPIVPTPTPKPFVCVGYFARESGSLYGIIIVLVLAVLIMVLSVVLRLNKEESTLFEFMGTVCCTKKAPPIARSRSKEMQKPNEINMSVLTAAELPAYREPVLSRGKKKERDMDPWMVMENAEFSKVIVGARQHAGLFRNSTGRMVRIEGGEEIRIFHWQFWWNLLLWELMLLGVGASTFLSERGMIGASLVSLCSGFLTTLGFSRDSLPIAKFVALQLSVLVGAVVNIVLKEYIFPTSHRMSKVGLSRKYLVSVILSCLFGIIPGCLVVIWYSWIVGVVLVIFGLFIVLLSVFGVVRARPRDSLLVQVPHGWSAREEEEEPSNIKSPTAQETQDQNESDNSDIEVVQIDQPVEMRRAVSITKVSEKTPGLSQSKSVSKLGVNDSGAVFMKTDSVIVNGVVISDS